MNYERLVQWIAGPVSTGVGLLATALFHTTVSHSAAENVAVLVLGTGVSYAAHHKWLTNLAKWWSEAGVALPAGLDPQGTPVTTVPTPDVQLSQEDRLRAQLHNAGITPEA